MDLGSVNIVMGWFKLPEEDRPDVWEKIQVITDALIKECLDEAERKAEEKKRNK